MLALPFSQAVKILEENKKSGKFVNNKAPSFAL